MQVLARQSVRRALAFLVVAGCGSPDAHGEDRINEVASNLPVCRFRTIDTHGWFETADDRRLVTLALPRGATKLPITDAPTLVGMWELPNGNVSLTVKAWGASWEDSAAVDFSASWPFCVDSATGGHVRIRARFGDPHPLGEGQYLIAYLPLDAGRVLVLRSFSRDASALDTLYAVATSIRVAP